MQQVDAELGGEVIKQRIARTGQGKSKASGRTSMMARRNSSRKPQGTFWRWRRSISQSY
jgi:hypothetical protein